ncbi:hypothetical protein [Pseudoalteromonas sp. BSi20495]|uniref:hypothetical protein n=1 Tax=Pseudoalteromonas sp. BSi20495 TaxID=386429 RepID=UPI0006ACAF93|nr:hypothetical protein [Pseudoalteromonas sp. BSi20495]
MNYRSLGRIALLEFGAIIVLVIIGTLWMLDPEGLYEPFFVFCGLVFLCTEFYRRYKVEEPEGSQSLDTLLESSKGRKKATPLVKKVKPEGVIAQCPSNTCNTIAKTSQEVEAYFGYRAMGDGKISLQSYCRKCRTA